MSKDNADLQRVLVSVAQVETQLKTLGENVNKLSSSIRSGEVGTKLDPIEGAKLNVTAAYAVASLFYILQNLQGQTSDMFPIQTELARIKGHVQKINDHSKAATAKSTSVAAPAPAVKLNKDAATRVISHHLSSTAVTVAVPTETIANTTSTDDVKEQQQRKKKKF